MKKTALTLITLMASILAIAQEQTLTREAHLMADSADLALFSVPFLPPGEAGEDKVWDLGVLDDAEPLAILSLRRDSLGRHSVIFGRELQSLAEDYGRLAFVECESPLRHSFHHTPGIVARFPFSYGDSIFSPYHHTGRYSGKYFSLEDGDYAIKADATGCLLLGGDTLRNVLRVHTRKTSRLAMSLDSIRLRQLPPKRQTTDYYAWYARGYRYPVACSVGHTLNDDAQPVTAIRKTYCLPPSIQAGIADPINEEIRRKNLVI